MGNFKISCTIILLFVAVNLSGQTSTVIYNSYYSAFFGIDYSRTGGTGTGTQFIRNDCGSNRYWRGYMKFNMSVIPTTAYITNTQFYCPYAYEGIESAQGISYENGLIVIDTTAGMLGIGNVIISTTTQWYYPSYNMFLSEFNNSTALKNYFAKGTNRTAYIIGWDDYNSVGCNWTIDVLYPPPALYVTYYLLPSTPTIISPENNSQLNNTTVTLSWSTPTEGATNYYLIVSTNSSFSGGTIFDGYNSTTSKQLTGLTYGTTYYWRVMAINPAGNSSLTSTYSFTIQATVTGSDDTSELQSIMGEK